MKDNQIFIASLIGYEETPICFMIIKQRFKCGQSRITFKIGTNSRQITNDGAKRIIEKVKNNKVRGFIVDYWNFSKVEALNAEFNEILFNHLIEE